MSFGIFQNEKTLFQSLKTRSSNSQKIDIFPKGLTHGFGPKMAIFPSFFLRQYRPGKCLLRYPKTKKKPFQAIKTRKSKSRKIDIFSKGLSHGFGPKMAIFPFFFGSTVDRWICRSMAQQIAGSVDRFIGTSLDLQIAGSVDRWICRSMNLQIAPSVDRWICKSVDLQIAGSVDRWICRSMDRQIDGSVDRQFGRSLDLQIAGSVDR